MNEDFSNSENRKKCYLIQDLNHKLPLSKEVLHHSATAAAGRTSFRRVFVLWTIQVACLLNHRRPLERIPLRCFRLDTAVLKAATYS